MRLTKYPKKGLSYDQIKDEEKLVKDRNRRDKIQICVCGCREFFVDTLGIEHCSECYAPMNIFR